MSKRGSDRGPKTLGRSITRIHEAGHVVVAWFDPYLPKVTKVTIKENKKRLGYARLKWKPHHSQTQGVEETKALMRFYLGGRVAEELTVGARLYGARNDLFEANRLAVFLIGEFGMSKEFGHTLPSFLAMGERTKQLVDDAIMDVMNERSEETRKLLRKKKQHLMAVAHALRENRTLKTKQLEAILGPRPKRKFSAAQPEKKTSARRK